MELKVLYSFPNCGEPDVETTDLNFTLSFRDGADNELKIHFFSVLAYRYANDSICTQPIDAYESLCEIKDSEQIRDYKTRRPYEYSVWMSRDFVVYFPDRGQFELIASDVVLERDSQWICEKCGGIMERTEADKFVHFTCSTCDHTFKI